MDWDRIYGIQQFVVFAVLTFVENLGWAGLAREYESEIGVLEVGLCGVGCAVVTVVLLQASAPTQYNYWLAAVTGVAAIGLAGAILSARLSHLLPWRR